MKEHHHDHDHECCGHCENKEMKETMVCDCPNCEDNGTSDCKCGCLDQQENHNHEHNHEHHHHKEGEACCGHCEHEESKQEKVCECPNCEDNGSTDCKCGCLDDKEKHDHEHNHEHHHHHHKEGEACCGHCEHEESKQEKVCECPGCKGNGTADCQCGCLEGKHEHHHDHANHEGHHHDMHHDHHHHEHAHHDHSGHDHSAHGHHGHHHHGNLSDFIIRFLVSLIFTIPILVLSPMIQDWFGFTLYWEYNKYITFGLATILLIYGGKPFYTSAVHELKAKEPAMMTLVTLAILVSYGYSTAVVFGLPGMDFFWELATLIAVMLLGHYFEMKSSMVASDALESISKLLPSTAHVVVGDEIIDKPLSDLKINDVVLVKPGEKVPVDGTVVEGTSSVDESLVTGESRPVLKELNSKVIGGTINGDSTLHVKVNKLGSDTYLSQVLNLVTSALQSKSKTQRLADIAAKYLFYVSITIALITWVTWGLLGAEGAFIAEKVVTVIVIACPHALGVAIPLVTSISTTLAAKKGLLIKNRSAFENARQINAVVFDKTGTLTEGKFSVSKVYPNNLSEKELVQIAINLETSSTHPIALGIMKYGRELKLEPKSFQSFKNIPGLGITATSDNQLFGAVSENYLVKEKISYDQKTYQNLIAKGETVIFVIKDQETLGMIALRDQVKANAKASIDALKAMGIETHMLTGDNDVVAKEVAETLGLDHYKASVLPHEKSLYIEALKQSKKVAMTGDGINDAPALATANLGVAIGAGTDVAIQTADIILVKNDPKDVVDLLKLSKKTYRKMVENLIWALAYNVLTLPLAAGILHFAGIAISPAIGAIFMSLSTIIVAINAQFLRVK